MESRKLIVILADISGYTRFMLESRTAALHGQSSQPEPRQLPRRFWNT